ncbi:MAG: cytochrome d ubiquinol oxidase subunit II [Actinobacteria bacterium]|nr:MAG: cytochrome d ubiquinol oxidase subunit II [Actinomycetota bacterium]
MSEPDVVAAVLWTGVTLYAVFGGADFGAGFWDLLAGGAERGARPRALADRSLTPVWEANHVWLIFVLVVAWTGFPRAFAAVTSTLFVPLLLAALGIVLRGAGFAFRKATGPLAARRLFGALFASSSVLVPFFLGAAVGAVASGRVPAHGAGDRLTSWLNPTSAVIGALFVFAGAYLAAIFLVADARREGDAEMVRYFRARAIGAAALAGALAAGGLVALRSDARPVFEGLVHEGLPLVIFSALCGAGALALLLAGARRGARPLAVGAVAAVIWGWGVAQYPYLLPSSLTVRAGAAPGATLDALLAVFGAAVAVVVPSLVLLYTLHQRARLEGEES